MTFELAFIYKPKFLRGQRSHHAIRPKAWRRAVNALEMGGAHHPTIWGSA